MTLSPDEMCGNIFSRTFVTYKGFGIWSSNLGSEIQQSLHAYQKCLALESHLPLAMHKWGMGVAPGIEHPLETKLSHKSVSYASNSVTKVCFASRCLQAILERSLSVFLFTDGIWSKCIYRQCISYGLWIDSILRHIGTGMLSIQTGLVGLLGTLLGKIDIWKHYCMNLVFGWWTAKVSSQRFRSCVWLLMIHVFRTRAWNESKPLGAA